MKYFLNRDIVKALFILGCSRFNSLSHCKGKMVEPLEIRV